MNYPVNAGRRTVIAARSQLSRPAYRVACRQVEDVQVAGIAQAARTQAVEYVTFGAIRATETLTDLETQAIRRNPLGAARYEAIVNTATAALVYIVAETGRL